MTSINWTNPPPGSISNGNTVDIWLISLSQPLNIYGSLRQLLSPCEIARAQRYKFDDHRRRFVVAHAAVRSILAEYLKTSPGTLEFVNGLNGKPRLAGDLAASTIEFNLSHSYEMALLGITRGREIGVDIECVISDYRFDEVAERFFTPREITALRALPPQLQRRAFFKCWTSKEAFLKAKGTGLTGKLDEVEIWLSSKDAVCISATVPGWALSELNLATDYEAALVLKHGLLPINGYLWYSAVLKEKE